MGAWGVNAFDNDGACDWAYNLEEVSDLSVVEGALDAAIAEGEEGYLDSDLGCEALAACEVLARVKGNWGERSAHTEVVDQWVERHGGKLKGKAEKLGGKAGRAIELVLGEGSELRELWEEAEEGKAWRAGVEELRGRVVG